MRILMLTQSYAPSVGGEESLVEALTTEMLARGHHVAIGTLRQPLGDPVQRPAGARVEALDSAFASLPLVYSDEMRRPAPPLPDPRTVVQLRRLLRDEQPDVVHAHNWLVYSYLPLDKPKGPALVLSLHDYSLVCPTKRFMRGDRVCSGPGPMKCLLCAGEHYGHPKGEAIALASKTLERQLRKHVDLFLPISDAVRARCMDNGRAPQRVIPDFLNALPDPPGADPRLEQLPDEPFILFFGDATVDKGAWELAEAYRSVPEAPPLVFIGRCFIDGLNARRGVHVLGPWPRELAIEALRRSLFVVVPSILPEPFGLVALETAALGKPVIASDTGGLRDIVRHGETGLLVPPGDRPALRAALLRLIGDADLRLELGEAAAKQATTFSSAAVVPRFEEAYRLAIEMRRGKRRSLAEPVSAAPADM
jgi:glycosyltransferase involved in cell wall biosynthesis